MGVIKCVKCGNEIHESDTKCIVCGTDLNMIKYELKRKQLEEEGKIRPNNKKNIVVVIELLIIIGIAILYFKLFVPRILDMTETKRESNLRERCIDQGGNWNKENETCVYDY